MNRHGTHSAAFAGCRVYRQEAKIQVLRAKENISYKEAKIKATERSVVIPDLFSRRSPRALPRQSGGRDSPSNPGKTYASYAKTLAKCNSNALVVSLIPTFSVPHDAKRLVRHTSPEKYQASDETSSTKPRLLSIASSQIQW